MNVILEGKSAIDSNYFISSMFNKEQVENFLMGYGVDPNNPISSAELFGNFQEAMQFIRRYFLKEGNPEGLEVSIPGTLFSITDISELFLMATGNSINRSEEDRLWAEIILKVMHTILHIDKDLRSNYFSIIQTQVFDRFYKHVYRGEENKLFLGDRSTHDLSIPLLEFETKSKKTRDSVIIKLLHKAENVAEELFDRIGIRFVTRTKVESLMVLKYLLEHNIVIPHNIKPSRSVNTLLDTNEFKKRFKTILRTSLRNNLTEERFLQALERECSEITNQTMENERNNHSSLNYRSLQFTCRQLIRYTNPFYVDFAKLRKEARKDKENSLAKKILSIDTSSISREMQFFYPYEIQIVDQESHKTNTEGEASHGEYKKAQLRSAMIRLFKPLIVHKNLKVEH